LTDLAASALTSDLEYRVAHATASSSIDTAAAVAGIIGGAMDLGRTKATQSTSLTRLVPGTT
jgi:hypothetical protein